MNEQHGSNTWPISMSTPEKVYTALDILHLIQSVMLMVHMIGLKNKNHGADIVGGLFYFAKIITFFTFI